MMSEILPNLYISDINHVSIFYSNYDLIVNCTTNIPFPVIHNETIRIPVNDDPSYAEKLYQIIKDKKVLQRIHQCLLSNRKVLVHCFAGMQRSCAVVACYLVKHEIMTPDESVAFIKMKRPIAFEGGVNFIETIRAVHHSVFEMPSYV